MCPSRPTGVVDEESLLDPNAITPGGNRSELIPRAPDTAYSLSQRSMLSVNTGELFPDGFPTDFSIVATFKAIPDSRSVLLSLYNNVGGEEMAIQIDDRIHLVYQVKLKVKGHNIMIKGQI